MTTFPLSVSKWFQLLNGFIFSLHSPKDFFDLVSFTYTVTTHSQFLCPTNARTLEHIHVHANRQAPVLHEHGLHLAYTHTPLFPQKLSSPVLALCLFTVMRSREKRAEESSQNNSPNANTNPVSDQHRKQ